MFQKTSACIISPFCFKLSGHKSIFTTIFASDCILSNTLLKGAARRTEKFFVIAFYEHITSITRRTRASIHKLFSILILLLRQSTEIPKYRKINNNNSNNSRIYA